MNPNASNRRTVAFTLVEMLVVIAIIGILAALLLPVLNRSEVRTKRVVCINVQQQIGLAFHAFSNDHNGKFPMAISTNDSGSLEYVQSGYESGPVFYTAYHHFQTLSNELVRQEILLCPAETIRVAATNFAALQNENVSYFVGVQSTFDKPDTILAGDRNLVTNSYDQPTILQLGPFSNLKWTWELHQYKGNVLFADGHVEQWNDSLMAAAAGASPVNQSLFMPSVVPGTEPQFAGGSPNSGGNGPSGPSGSSPSGSDGSGSTPPSQAPPSSSQWAPLSSMGGGGNSASSPSQVASPPGGQPMSMPSLSGSSGESLYATETVSQVESTDRLLIARSVPPPPSADTDEVVSVQDTNTAMSPFDQQMTITMQHSLLWLYLLLCLLVLLYLLNRLRKRMQKERERQEE